MEKIKNRYLNKKIKKQIICDKISKGSLSNGHKIKLIKTIVRTSFNTCRQLASRVSQIKSMDQKHGLGESYMRMLVFDGGCFPSN